MTNFPAKLLVRVCLRAVMLASFAAMPGFADIGVAKARDSEPPISPPRSLLQPDRPTDDDPEQTTTHRPLAGHSDTVTSSDLMRVGTRMSGMLESRDGGFGDDVWRASTMETVAALLARLNPPPPGVRASLHARLVLSRAFDPLEAVAGTRAPFEAQRAQTLLSAGFLREAERALDQAETPLSDLDSLQVRAEILLLTQRTRSACALAARTRARAFAPYWVRLRTLCYLVAADRAAAQLGSDLLEEGGYRDPLFFMAVANNVSDARFDYGALVPQDGVHFGLLTAWAAETFPQVLLNATAPALKAGALQGAAALARSQDEILTIQIPLAEDGVESGALAPQSLRGLYTSVVMGDGEARALMRDFDPATRLSPAASTRLAAALDQALHAAVLPSDQAERLQAAWHHASQRGRRALFVALYSDSLSSVPVDPALDYFAHDLAAASLYAGDYARAGRWLALAREFDQTTAGPGDAARDERTENLAAALFLVSPGHLLPVQVSENGKSAPVWNLGARLERARTPGQSRKMWLELSLFRAFGGEMDADTRAALAALQSEFPGPGGARMPAAGVLSGLDAAARAGRRGETVLLALLALGDSKSAQIPIIVVEKTVSALVRTGFVEEAKTLAIESLLADL